MADFAALPLFTDAYLADTAHLTDAEHGCYLRILMLMWRSPGCRLPDDDKWLSRKLSKSCEDIISHVRPLMREFCESDGNWVTQKRLQKEWLYVQRAVKQRTDSAKSRLSKEKNSSIGYARNKTPAVRSHVPSPSPSPTIPVGAKPPDLKSQLFGECLIYLANGNGKDPDKYRPVIGRWIKNHGEEKTLSAFLRAQKEHAVDPVAFIEGCLKKRLQKSPQI